MPTVVADRAKITIPVWVTDIDAFRRWFDSEELPEKFRAWFLDGEVWVDMSKEQVFTHVDVKGAIFAVLWVLAHAARTGRVYQDGLLLTHRAAGLSGNPDAVYVSHAAVADGRVKQIPGAEVGFVELEGTPDMVLEVVSDSSEKKDNQVLREAYWEAGIPEYWLVDARGEEVEFDLLLHGPKGYKAARKVGGWVKSTVFGKSFKLNRDTDPNGNPEFTLEVK